MNLHLTLEDAKIKEALDGKIDLWRERKTEDYPASLTIVLPFKVSGEERLFAVRVKLIEANMPEPCDVDLPPSIIEFGRELAKGKSA